jgi:hypothetical protein
MPPRRPGSPWRKAGSRRSLALALVVALGEPLLELVDDEQQPRLRGRGSQRKCTREAQRPWIGGEGAGALGRGTRRDDSKPPHSGRRSQGERSLPTVNEPYAVLNFRTARPRQSRPPWTLRDRFGRPRLSGPVEHLATAPAEASA